MPLTTASAVTFFHATGYPIGVLAVSAMAPWPRGAQFGHVVVVGLLIQAVQFCCLYEAVQLGSPAVLCAVVIAMNPVATAVLAAVFLRERLGPQRAAALALGVAAVLAACANRLAIPTEWTRSFCCLALPCWVFRPAASTSSDSAPVSTFVR